MREASPRPGDLHWPMSISLPLIWVQVPKGEVAGLGLGCRCGPALKGPTETPPPNLEASSPQHWLPDLLQEWVVLPWVGPRGLASLQRAIVSRVLCWGDPRTGHGSLGSCALFRYPVPHPCHGSLFLGGRHSLWGRNAW